MASRHNLHVEDVIRPMLQDERLKDSAQRVEERNASIADTIVAAHGLYAAEGDVVMGLRPFAILIAPGNASPEVSDSFWKQRCQQLDIVVADVAQPHVGSFAHLDPLIKELVNRTVRVVVGRRRLF
jgi:hypothetical protein